jgi:hypothetical protein
VDAVEDQPGPEALSRPLEIGRVPAGKAAGVDEHSDLRSSASSRSRPRCALPIFVPASLHAPTTPPPLDVPFGCFGEIGRSRSLHFESLFPLLLDLHLHLRLGLVRGPRPHLNNLPPPALEPYQLLLTVSTLAFAFINQTTTRRLNNPYALSEWYNSATTTVRDACGYKDESGSGRGGI